MSAQRIFILAAGLTGAAGVALSAAAAHAGGAHVATAANFLLFHAAVFLAIGTAKTNRLLKSGGFALLLGLVFFAGDLVSLDYLGHRLFPFAAPAGGFLMIAGWLTAAISAFAGEAD